METMRDMDEMRRRVADEMGDLDDYSAYTVDYESMYDHVGEETWVMNRERLMGELANLRRLHDDCMEHARQYKRHIDYWNKYLGE